MDHDSSRGAWVLADAGALKWRQWDDELVVMDLASGSIHLLSGVGAAVFLSLYEAGGEPVAVSQLEDWLIDPDDESSATASSDPQGRGGGDALQSALLEFKRIGLATQIPS